MTTLFSWHVPPLWLVLLALSASLFCVENASSFPTLHRAPLVSTDDGQVQVLLQLANSWPALQTRSTGAWTETNLKSACASGSSAYGILSCNGTGFVKELGFEDTSITVGQLPDLVASLEALTSFSSFGPISGTLPFTWSALTQLQTLQLTGSHITGNIPPQWSSMTALETVVLSWASASGDASSAALIWPEGVLPVSSSLSSLALMGYNFGANNPLPVEFFTSATLSSLSLRSIIFDGSVSAGLLNNTKLDSVEIIADQSVASSSPATSPSTVPFLPNDWSIMRALTSISFQNLPWLGNYPTALPPNLNSLTLVNLPLLTGSATIATVSYSSMQVIVLDNLPKVGGAIPCPAHPESSSLKKVSFNRVGFTGTLNASIFWCPELESLTITNMMKLTPQPLPNPPNIPCKVQSLNLSSSGFIGSFQPFIHENCTASTLDLSGNNLTGSLPNAWATSSFTTFDVSNNQLSGSLPPSLGSLFSSSATVSLAKNQLSGYIPEAYYRAYRSLDISENNFDLCANASDITTSSFAPSLYCAIYPQQNSLCGCADDNWPSTCDFSVACNPTSPTDTTPSPEPLSPVDTPTMETPTLTPSEAGTRLSHSLGALVLSIFLLVVVVGF